VAAGTGLEIRETISPGWIGERSSTGYAHSEASSGVKGRRGDLIRHLDYHGTLARCASPGSALIACDLCCLWPSEQK
jgi:hypothetical protein